ncbi:MAG: GntR family transcriptional regulator [Cyanobacteria bacterium RU_5_0]|nr:GntR family transcriptional regulator [Cyanobacteria bacterium RU_5_0]
MTLSLPSVQRSKSLYEQTYLALRASILSGELVSGERLVETQLAEHLQVSRTPIREAMRQLQRDALVVADTNGGLRVTTISAIDAAQLYDCRIALEQLSVQEACQSATKTQLYDLEALVTQAEQLVGQQSETEKGQGNGKTSIVAPSEMLELDYRFHRLIAESSGNRWLVTLLDQVFDKMALIRVQTTQHNPRVLEIRDEHRQIFQAIAQHKVPTAVEAIQTHLLASKARVIQEVQNLNLESGSEL